MLLYFIRLIFIFIFNLQMRIDVNTSEPHAKRTCIELAMVRMRSSNYKLHKLFKKYNSVDEARAHCPIGLSQPDWDKKNVIVSHRNPLRYNYKFNLKI